MPVKGPAAMPESLLVSYNTLALFAAGRRTGRSEAAQRQQGVKDHPRPLLSVLRRKTRSGRALG